MGSRIEGVLKNISTIANSAGNPPHCPDGVWFETGSTDAEILAETSVAGGQLKMSSGGKLYLSDANDGKYHDISIRSYGSCDGTTSLTQAANTYFNLSDRLDTDEPANRIAFVTASSSFYIPPIWGPVLFTLSFAFPAGSSITNTELRITDTSGSTGTAYEWGGPGSNGCMTFEANLFPEFKSGSSVDEVTMLKRALILEFKYLGTKTFGGIEYTLSWVSLPGCLLSDG